MNEWQQEKPKLQAGDIVAKLYDDAVNASMAFANGEMQHDEWSAEMRLIDQRLGIFGIRLDRPERFAKSGRV